MTDSVEGARSVQERYFPALTCFGCGPVNTKGLRLRSYVEPDGASVRASFLPWPEHDNGTGFLNGGIISTLLDCHSAAAMVIAAARAGLEPDGTLQYVTAGLDVRFRRPSPLREAVELRARAVAVSEAQIDVEAALWWEDRERATATAVWKRWRPRA